MKAPAADRLEFAVDGVTVKVMSRPADDGDLARLFELQTGPTSGSTTPLSDDGIAGVACGPIEPLSVSLPGAPDGLSLQMDERGDGHLYALGEDRMRLGSDGMWWIVSCIIEALQDPQTVATWPRFLTVAGPLGGPATQASLQFTDSEICLVWRRLESGVVGDVVAMQELSHDRAAGWLCILEPVLLDIEKRRVHRERLLPARTAERWAHALERWSA
ncbi:MAG: hypothetical protein ABSA21_03130 [Candidatus Limnocylindrales bacterium]